MMILALGLLLAAVGGLVWYLRDFDRPGRWALVVGLALFLVSFPAAFLSQGVVVSTGERAGIVQKASRKGLLWTTTECELALSGLDGQGMPRVWEFSLDEEARHGEQLQALSDRLEVALRHREPVTLFYREGICLWPWRAATNHTVYSVRGSEAVDRLFPTGGEQPR